MSIWSTSVSSLLKYSACWANILCLFFNIQLGEAPSSQRVDDSGLVDWAMAGTPSADSAIASRQQRAQLKDIHISFGRLDEKPINELKVTSE